MRKWLTMQKRLAVALLVLSGPMVSVVATVRDARDPDLVVHEWGTFTSVAGADGQATRWTPFSAASDLPCFVTVLSPQSVKVPVNRWLPTFEATVRMETPVLYFYSNREATVDVRVRFPQGLITEWYPRALVPSPMPRFDLAQTTGFIHWRGVKIRPGAEPTFATEPGDSHYYAARATDASPVEVDGQRERFLFYRGLASFPVSVSARVEDDGTIAVENAGTRGIRSLIVFESDGRHLGYRVVGNVEKETRLKRPRLNGTIASLRPELERILTDEGLYPREARAMVETWRDTWFERGLRLLYLVPQTSVDAILPLEIVPAPARVVRTFVGRLELITAEMQTNVEQALLQDDLPALVGYGRFLGPIASRIAAKPSSVVDQSRIDAATRAVAESNEASTRRCSKPGL